MSNPRKPPGWSRPAAPIQKLGEPKRSTPNTNRSDVKTPPGDASFTGPPQNPIVQAAILGGWAAMQLTNSNYKTWRRLLDVGGRDVVPVTTIPTQYPFTYDFELYEVPRGHVLALSHFEINYLYPGGTAPNGVAVGPQEVAEQPTKWLNASGGTLFSLKAKGNGPDYNWKTAIRTVGVPDPSRLELPGLPMLGQNLLDHGTGPETGFYFERARIVASFLTRTETSQTPPTSIAIDVRGHLLTNDEYTRWAYNSGIAG